MSNRSEALTMALASMAVGMISEDPELIGKLRGYAESKEAPFDAGDINGTLLSMAEMDVLGKVKQVLDDGDDHSTHLHAVIPVPDVPGAAAESAEALGVGSFTTEFVHAADGVFEQFKEWMGEAHPQAVREDQEIRKPQVERADQLLTTMANVAGRIADARDGDLRKREDGLHFEPGDGLGGA